MASPVMIQFSGQVLETNCSICSVPDPFGGFVSLGDEYHATVRFDTANAVQTLALPGFARYELIGAVASVRMNGFEFSNHPTARILAFVTNNDPYDIFTIDISTVPVDSEFKPIAAGPHGVTEITLGLQDNSASALKSTSLPTHESAIWSAQWQRSELVHDPEGHCLGRGCAGGISGLASLEVRSLRATVPEPATLLLALMGACGLIRRR